MPAAPAATPPQVSASATSGATGKPAASPSPGAAGASPGPSASPNPSKLSPADQVKPGPAKSKLFADLDSVLQKTNPAATAAGDVKTKEGEDKRPDADKENPGADGKEGDTTAPGDGKEEGEAADKGQEAEAGKEGDKTANAPTDKAGKKVSPWKLVDQYKGRVTVLEKEVAELKKSGGNPQEKADLLKRIETAETKLKAYEEEIKYVDYSKSEEFKTKFVEPYEKAWKNALSELRDLSIDTPQGPRPVKADDILDLVNMPLGKARELAEERFGPFADDVMTHRKELRKLFEAQSDALENARKTGTEREKAKQEQVQREQQELQKVVSESWNAAHEEATNHPELGRFFKTIEGDEEHNKRLIRGYQLVDEAFAANPAAPGLSPEKRSEIVKMHAAVRHRAAAFGGLVARLKQADAKVAELQKQIEQFKASKPGVGGSQSSQQPATTTGKAGLFSKLEKLAHH